MKRVINGITFNTNTSTLIARYRFFDGGGPTYGISKTVSVFQTRGGDFFELYAWTERGRHDAQYCLRPLTRANLACVLMKAKNLEVIDRAALVGEHPNEFEESRTEATVFVRLPMNLKRRLDDAGAPSRRLRCPYYINVLSTARPRYTPRAGAGDARVPSALAPATRSSGNRGGCR